MLASSTDLSREIINTKIMVKKAHIFLLRLDLCLKNGGNAPTF